MTTLTRDDVQEQVEARIAEHWTAGITVRRWWAHMAAAGYTSPTLPVAAGGLGEARRPGRRDPEHPDPLQRAGPTRRARPLAGRPTIALRDPTTPDDDD